MFFSDNVQAFTKSLKNHPFSTGNAFFRKKTVFLTRVCIVDRIVHISDLWERCMSRLTVKGSYFRSAIGDVLWVQPSRQQTPRGESGPKPGNISSISGNLPRSQRIFCSCQALDLCSYIARFNHRFFSYFFLKCGNNIEVTGNICEGFCTRVLPVQNHSHTYIQTLRPKYYHEILSYPVDYSYFA